MSQELRGILQDGLREVGLDAPPEACDRVLAYAALLQKWNQAYNLTGIRDPLASLRLNILDSLVMLPWCKGASLADIGTGAGLPGIPLAIFRPDLKVLLIDSNSKKTRFMFQAKTELGLDNVTVWQGRVEDYASGAQVAIVTSRAFASLADFVRASRHLLAPSGVFLAMKGQYPRDEIDALPAGFRVSAVHALRVPGVAAERHLVEITADPAP